MSGTGVKLWAHYGVYPFDRWEQVACDENGILLVTPTAGTLSYEEDTDTGATTAAWADALDWDARQLSEKTIILTNTDAVNSLDYRVYTRAYYTGQNFQEVTGTLVAGANTRIALVAAHSRVIVQVVDTAPPAHADFQIDTIGRKY